ncbi:MAG: DUF1127 domain-containing protein [Pseudomonadota bacterium]
MYALESRHSAPLLSRVLHLIAALPRAWMRRRQMLTLLDLDDKMLKDIGVTRGEVEIAAGLPLWRNAALDLHRMGLERRRMRM